MPDPQLPPWMSSQPPGPPPPMPPPATWPGPPPPPPAQGSGFLVTIGVLNLIFSLACGCASGIWAMSWREIHERPEEIATAIETKRDKFRESLDQILRSRPDSSDSDDKARGAVVDAATTPPAVTAALSTVADHPSTPAIQTATMIGGIAQAVLLLGSILLLARKGLGRALSMLALAGFIAATVATFMKFPQVAHDSGRALAAKVTDSGAFQALGAAEQAQARQMVDFLPLTAQGLVFLASIVAAVWPGISLLILLLSRGIREACRPRYGPP